jgi:hypothetical protein
MWRCGDDAMVDEVDSVDLGKLQIGVKVRWDDKEFEIVRARWIFGMEILLTLSCDGTRYDVHERDIEVDECGVLFVKRRTL